MMKAARFKIRLPARQPPKPHQPKMSSRARAVPCPMNMGAVRVKHIPTWANKALTVAQKTVAIVSRRYCSC